MRKLMTLSTTLALLTLFSCGGGGGGGGTANVQEQSSQSSQSSESQSSQPSQSQEQAQEQEITVTGQVLASRVTGVEVCFEDNCVSTDSEGSFSIEVPSLPATLLVRSTNVVLGNVTATTPAITIDPLALAQGNEAGAEKIGSLLHLLAGDYSASAETVDLSTVVTTTTLNLQALARQEQQVVVNYTDPEGSEKTALVSGNGNVALKENSKLTFYHYKPDERKFEKGAEVDVEKSLLAIDSAVQLWVEGVIDVKDRKEYPNASYFSCDNWDGTPYHGTIHITKTGTLTYRARYYDCTFENDYDHMNGTIEVVGKDSDFHNSTIRVVSDFTYSIPDGTSIQISSGAEGNYSSSYGVGDPEYVAHSSPDFTINSFTGTVKVNGEAFRISSLEGSGELIFTHSFKNFTGNATFESGVELSPRNLTLSYYDTDDRNTFHPLEVDGNCTVNGTRIEF